MFREVIRFVINGMAICFNTMKLFILDKVGNLNISLYSFFIFVIFMGIAIRLIGFIKGIEEIRTEKQENFDREQKNAYNEWLRNHPSTPRRYKK